MNLKNRTSKTVSVVTSKMNWVGKVVNRKLILINYHGQSAVTFSVFMREAIVLVLIFGEPLGRIILPKREIIDNSNWKVTLIWQVWFENDFIITPLHYTLFAYVSEEILNWQSFSLSADLCIHFHCLSWLSQASQRRNDSKFIPKTKTMTGKISYMPPPKDYD